jgi:D-serine deaminase-like pyridoxal phosphate-dependent protein
MILAFAMPLFLECVPCHVCATLERVPWYAGCWDYGVIDRVCLAMQDTGVMVLTSQGPELPGLRIWSK